jgi:uncharacterized membrane protein YdjX (TVP38/TMEM64 family)
MRLFWILFGLAAAVLVPFAIWGDTFDGWFTGDAAITWIRERGPYGWLAVILLLMSDLVLPIPGTAVMSAAGYLWGPLVGGLIAATGSFCSGMFAYGLCRRFGRGVAEKLAGAKDLERGERVFRDRGVLFVAISRSFPLLAEVIPCLAGLTRMPFREFVGALGLGCLPMAFIFAYIGSIGQEDAGLALGLSVAVPAVFWAAVHFWLRRQK